MEEAVMREIEIFGIPALFTERVIQPDKQISGMYYYELISAEDNETVLGTVLRLRLRTGATFTTPTSCWIPRGRCSRPGSLLKSTSPRAMTLILTNGMEKRNKLTPYRTAPRKAAL